MTTEQCSVDSLLPKSRTETFARQLQNRLRTLNSNEVDGLEDTSWNGDQHSSSSEDIYYDLDSYPGSPAEEATEVDFTNYINVKTANSACPSSTNGYLYQNSRSVQSGTNVEHEHLGQCSRTNPAHHCSNTNSTKCFCTTTPEQEFDFEQCASRDVHCDGGNCSVSISKLNHISNHNGLSSETLPNHKNEVVKDINGHNYLNPTKLNCLENETNERNGINDRLSFNGTDDELHIATQNTLHNEENNTQTDFTDCLCLSINTDDKSVDVNRNSTKNNKSTYNASKNSFPTNLTTEIGCSRLLQKEVENDILNNTDELNDILSENDCIACLEYENYTVCNDQQFKSDKENYTEEDLSRLVDAVFLKSQENDFDENTNQEITITIENESHTKNSHADEEEEETIENKRAKFRRCSSLKTGKTPPGTPGCKKIVRFADVLGLDLADVRTFLDEVPKVPKSAFFDLKNVELSSSPPVNTLHSLMGHDTIPQLDVKPLRTIVPLFQQPSSRPEFLNRVREKFVCLENAVITDAALSVITGVVRVRNIDYHKSVHVRYSIDNWKSFADLQAKYVVNSYDGFSDKFTFVLYSHMLNVGQRLEFAVRYHTKGAVFWDNNLGANYAFQCVPEGPTRVLPASYLPAGPLETWASFY